MSEIYINSQWENDWVDNGKLAGRLPDVHLNDHGQAQARALGERLASVPFKAVYSSPMERTRETAAAVVAHHPGLTVQLLEGVNELDIGVWKGEAIQALSRRKMWGIVQVYPSRAQFPEGETLRQAQARAVDAIEAVAQQHPRETIAVVSHADIIALILTHYLGAHIDTYQRIQVSAASISVLRLSHARPMIVSVNDTSHCPPPPQSDGATGRARA